MILWEIKYIYLYEYSNILHILFKGSQSYLIYKDQEYCSCSLTFYYELNISAMLIWLCIKDPSIILDIQQSFRFFSLLLFLLYPHLSLSLLFFHFSHFWMKYFKIIAIKINYFFAIRGYVSWSGEKTILDILLWKISWNSLIYKF